MLPAKPAAYLGNLYINGGRQEDTIPFGIMSLASSNIAVAAVVFFYRQYLGAVYQSHVMFTLTVGKFSFKCEQDCDANSAAASGDMDKVCWSMLIFFVISLTMSLINRDQILAFTMGPAVLFRRSGNFDYSAVEWLDSRYFWDAHESGKRPLRKTGSAN